MLARGASVSRKISKLTLSPNAFFYAPALWPSSFAAIYADITTATAALQSQAKVHGYALFKRDSQPPKRELTKIIYACDKEGKVRSISSRLKDPTIHEKRQRPGSRSKKCGIVISMAHEVDRCTPESLDQQVCLAGRQVEIARPLYFNNVKAY
jgi:hypothetical protein